MRPQRIANPIQNGRSRHVGRLSCLDSLVPSEPTNGPESRDVAFAAGELGPSGGCLPAETEDCIDEPVNIVTVEMGNLRTDQACELLPP